MKIINKTVGHVIVVIAGLLLVISAKAQVHQPVKWRFTAVPLNDSEATLIFTVSLDDGWHIYSQFIGTDGPLPTTFTFQPSEDYSLLGKVKEESTPHKSYDKTFMMDVVWFDKTAVFTQNVKVHSPTTIIKGKVEFMVCTDEMCLPPDEIEFSLAVKVDKPVKKKSNKQSAIKKAMTDSKGVDVNKVVEEDSFIVKETATVSTVDSAEAEVSPAANRNTDSEVVVSKVYNGASRLGYNHHRPSFHPFKGSKIYLKPAFMIRQKVLRKNYLGSSGVSTAFGAFIGNTSIQYQ